LRIRRRFESTARRKKAQATGHLSPAKEDTRDAHSRIGQRKLEGDLDFSFKQA
jgi:hypothetical protein